MSKSLGNFFTVRDVLKTLRDPEVLRFFLLGSHYRGPINYSAAQLAQADETLAGLYRALKDTTPSPAGAEESGGDPALEKFHAAMDDDFNTPEAMAVLAGVAREFNIAKAADEAARTAAAARSLLAMGKVLGLLQQSPEAYLKRGGGQRRSGDAYGCTDRGTHRRAPRGAGSQEFPRVRPYTGAAERGGSPARGQAGWHFRMAPSLKAPQTKKARGAVLVPHARFRRRLLASICSVAGATTHHYAENHSDHGRNADDLPGIVAHVAVGGPGDLARLTAHLRRRCPPARSSRR